MNTRSRWWRAVAGYATFGVGAIVVALAWAHSGAWHLDECSVEGCTEEWSGILGNGPIWAVTAFACVVLWVGAVVARPARRRVRVAWAGVIGAAVLIANIHSLWWAPTFAAVVVLTISRPWTDRPPDG